MLFMFFRTESDSLMIAFVSESSFWKRTKLSVLPSWRRMFLYACSAIFKNSFSMSAHVQLSGITSCWSVNRRQLGSFSWRIGLGKYSAKKMISLFSTLPGVFRFHGNKAIKPFPT